MYMSAERAIEIIHECGGRAFLAHPMQYFPHEGEVLEALCGKVDGIECWHYSANEEQSAELVRFCTKHGLLKSGGSDFHGNAEPGCEVGTGLGGRLCVTKEMLGDWVLA